MSIHIDPCKWQEQIKQEWGTRNHPETTGPSFVFVDGPPFASSDKLHCGHGLIGSIKSTKLNYMEMCGFNVKNKLGVDVHGLPSENAAIKRLGINNIHEISVDEFIPECKKMIMEFSTSWQPIYRSLGRFCNFNNMYMTMDINFMESVWYIFGELWRKKLVYHGNRVLAYSTKCQTPLSNFEASQNYQNIKSRTLYVKFKLKNENIYLVAWTTTPWTLPSNQALCISQKEVYSVVEYNGEQLCLHSSSFNKLFGKQKPIVIKTINGIDLIGKEYLPQFPYVKNKYTNFKFKVLHGDFVKIDHINPKGTGIVHIAPSFGEDDYNMCINNGIIDKIGETAFLPIDEFGNFTDEVDFLKGLYFSDNNTQTEVIKQLKMNGLHIKTETIEHSYPFCYRTNTQLMYRKSKSFFVKVSEFKDKLVEENKTVEWFPQNIGSNKGRFNEWISNAKDWSITRNRVFGTPIPVWVSDDGEEMVCIGSINELIELSGVKEINDLHRDTIDKISIPSKKTPGTYLKRVDDVFDCWFESGSVILAQDHYPFDKKEFVPADFICEGIDQTRGWFYTQLVLSVALFGKAPYKQVVCGGLILDEHGNKMSKSKGNVISPTTMIDKYGADFFRLYVVTSPASRAEEFKFSDKELYDLKKKLGPWMNAYNFYLGMKEFYETNFKESIDDFIVTDEHKTIFDIWIENRTEQFKYLLLECYKTNNFDFKDIILEFAEDLTNIYIKFNRHRLKRSTKQDRIIGIKTLESVLRKATIVITPIMPFWGEYFWKQFGTGSVFENRFEYDYNKDFDETIIFKMKQFINVIKKGRMVRNNSKEHTSTKVPLNYGLIGSFDDKVIDFLITTQYYIKEELNIINLEFENVRDKVEFEIKINNTLGKVYGKDFSNLKKTITKLTTEQLEKANDDGYIKIDLGMKEIILTERNEDYLLKPKSKEKVSKDTIVVIEDGIYIKVDLSMNQFLFDLTKQRHLTSRINKVRKTLGLKPSQYATMKIKCSNTISEDLTKFVEDLFKTTKTKVEFVDHDDIDHENAEDNKYLGGYIKIE